MTEPESAKANGHAAAVPAVRVPAGAGIAMMLAGEDLDIPVAEIDDGHNARTWFDPEQIRILAKNIDANGLLNRLILYRDPASGRYGLIAGGRRLRAVRDVLGWETAPARVLKDPPDEARRSELGLIDNEQHHGLDDIQLGIRYQNHIQRHGTTASDLAEKLGIKAVSTVTRRIKLAAGLSKDLQERVQGRRPPPLPPAVARELLPLPEPEQIAIAKLYPDTLKTQQDVRSHVRAARNGTAAPASFTCVEGGVKISIVLPAGDLSLAEPALKVVVKDLHDHARKGLAHFREYLVRKAKLAAAQDALAGHVSQQPERSES
jgi:ParB/RepB/Spo0J family partition protein